MRPVCTFGTEWFNQQLNHDDLEFKNNFYTPHRDTSCSFVNLNTVPLNRPKLLTHTIQSPMEFDKHHQSLGGGNNRGTFLMNLRRKKRSSMICRIPERWIHYLEDAGRIRIWQMFTQNLSPFLCCKIFQAEIIFYKYSLRSMKLIVWLFIMFALHASEVLCGIKWTCFSPDVKRLIFLLSKRAREEEENQLRLCPLFDLSLFLDWRELHLNNCFDGKGL